MVDPVFKAPTPPPPVDLPKEVNTDVNVNTETQSLPQEDASHSTATSQPETQQSAVVPDQKKQILNRLNELKTKMISYFWYSLGGLFLLGLFFGCTMFGGGEPPAPAPKGLTNIVPNKIKGRLPICGKVRQSEACVFYILNNSIMDKVAEDFFLDVARLTQRQDRHIKTENVSYAKEKIPPGYFAEIVIPINR